MHFNEVIFKFKPAYVHISQENIYLFIDERKSNYQTDFTTRQWLRSVSDFIFFSLSLQGWIDIGFI